MSGHKNAEHAPMRNHGICSYPSCKHRKIGKQDPMVEWRDVRFAAEGVHSELSPMAKLAVVANPSDYAAKSGLYSFDMELHPECAAEWGMHLIKDAIAANIKVGRKLRGE